MGYFLKFAVCLALWATPKAEAYTEIQYQDLYPIPEKQKSLIESWTENRQFCFHSHEEAQEATCFPISQVREIQVRNRGDWSHRMQDAEFINMLPAPEQEIALEFATLHMRCLDLGIDNRFVVEVQFIKSEHPTWSNRFSQTLYLTGRFHGDSINPIYPEIETMGFSNNLDRSSALLQALIHISKYKESPTRNNLNSQLINDHLPIIRLSRKILRLHALNRNPSAEEAKTLTE